MKIILRSIADIEQWMRINGMASILEGFEVSAYLNRKKN